MPYKSEAQRGKFHLLLKQGKIKASVVKEFDEASKGMKLPHKVSKTQPKSGNQKAKPNR